MEVILIKKLLTIADIAKELNIPESTARYYRDNFIDYIPSVGEGRKKRYRPETIEVLRFIAQGFKNKLTAMEIENGLSQMFPRNIDIEDTNAITTTAVQQQSENEIKQYAQQLQLALEQMSKTMEIIADQKEEITELRKHIAEIEKKQEEHEQKLNDPLQNLHEVQKEIATTNENKRKWWKFWE